jgi:hypothetical protein
MVEPADLLRLLGVRGGVGSGQLREPHPRLGAAARLRVVAPLAEVIELLVPRDREEPAAEGGGRAVLAELGEVDDQCLEDLLEDVGEVLVL